VSLPSGETDSGPTEAVVDAASAPSRPTLSKEASQATTWEGPTAAGASEEAAEVEEPSARPPVPTPRRTSQEVWQGSLQKLKKAQVSVQRRSSAGPLSSMTKPTDASQTKVTDLDQRRISADAALGMSKAAVKEKHKSSVPTFMRRKSAEGLGERPSEVRRSSLDSPRARKSSCDPPGTRRRQYARSSTGAADWLAPDLSTEKAPKRRAAFRDLMTRRAVFALARSQTSKELADPGPKPQSKGKFHQIGHKVLAGVKCVMLQKRVVCWLSSARHERVFRERMAKLAWKVLECGHACVGNKTPARLRFAWLGEHLQGMISELDELEENSRGELNLEDCRSKFAACLASVRAQQESVGLVAACLQEIEGHQRSGSPEAPLWRSLQKATDLFNRVQDSIEELEEAVLRFASREGALPERGASLLRDLPKDRLESLKDAMHLSGPGDKIVSAMCVREFRELGASKEELPKLMTALEQAAWIDRIRMTVREFWDTCTVPASKLFVHITAVEERLMIEKPESRPAGFVGGRRRRCAAREATAGSDVGSCHRGGDHELTSGFFETPPTTAPESLAGHANSDLGSTRPMSEAEMASCDDSESSESELTESESVTSSSSSSNFNMSSHTAAAVAAEPGGDEGEDPGLPLGPPSFVSDQTSTHVPATKEQKEHFDHWGIEVSPREGWGDSEPSNEKGALRQRKKSRASTTLDLEDLPLPAEALTVGRQRKKSRASIKLDLEDLPLPTALGAGRQGKKSRPSISDDLPFVEEAMRTVKIDRSDGSELGLVLNTNTLVIESITDNGLVAAWNIAAQDPGTMLRVGDRVLAANGHSSPVAILAECEKQAVLNLLFSKDSCKRRISRTRPHSRSRASMSRPRSRASFSRPPSRAGLLAQENENAALAERRAGEASELLRLEQERSMGRRWAQVRAQKQRVAGRSGAWLGQLSCLLPGDGKVAHKAWGPVRKRPVVLVADEHVRGGGATSSSPRTHNLHHQFADPFKAYSSGNPFAAPVGRAILGGGRPHDPAARKVPTVLLLPVLSCDGGSSGRPSTASFGGPALGSRPVSRDAGSRPGTVGKNLLLGR